MGYVHMLRLLFKPYKLPKMDLGGGHWTPVFVPLPSMTTLNQSPSVFHQTSFFLSFPSSFLPPSLAYWDECLNSFFFFFFLKLLEPRIVP